MARAGMARASREQDGADGIGIPGFRRSLSYLPVEFSIVRSAGDFIHRDWSIELHSTVDTSPTALTPRTSDPGARARTMRPAGPTRMASTPGPERNAAHFTQEV